MFAQYRFAGSIVETGNITKPCSQCEKTHWKISMVLKCCCYSYLDVPLASVLVVVVLVVLLDRHVGQVDERVVHLAHLAVVLRGAKSIA